MSYQRIERQRRANWADGADVINGNPTVRILVVANNYQIFHNWCRLHGVHPNSPNVTYISNATRITGWNGDTYYVNFGTTDPAINSALRGLIEIGAVKQLET